MFGTKKKLMTAVVMLVISAIMMTSASYAWFTISTNPEVRALETKVVVNENLEIALAKTNAEVTTSSPTLPSAPASGDTGNQYTWGNIINLGETTKLLNGSSGTNEYGALNKTLRPLTLNSSATIFQYPSYGSDGRVDALNGIYLVKAADGIGNLTTTSSGTSGKVHGYYVDFWIRSNIEGDLELIQEGVDRNSGGEDGLGSYYQTNATSTAYVSFIRVAFQDITPTSASGADNDAHATTSIAKTGTLTSGKYPLDIGTDHKVIGLKANKAKLIRMYVYIEGNELGNEIQNEDAFIGDTLDIGTLNIQFMLDGATNDVNNSMDLS